MEALFFKKRHLTSLQQPGENYSLVEVHIEPWDETTIWIFSKTTIYISSKTKNGFPQRQQFGFPQRQQFAFPQIQKKWISSKAIIWISSKTMTIWRPSINVNFLDLEIAL